MRGKLLSAELRTGRGGHIGERRGITALALVAAGSMGVIVLYQMGLIKHLPGPPVPHMDADEVDASGEAYEKLAMPDAALGLGSYAVTLGLAAAGGLDRARRRPWLPLAMAGKVGVDALQAGKLTVDQWVKHRAFCSWCLLAAGATFAMVPLAMPEARAALRTLSARKKASPPPTAVRSREDRVGAR